MKSFLNTYVDNIMIKTCLGSKKNGLIERSCQSGSIFYPNVSKRSALEGCCKVSMKTCLSLRKACIKQYQIYFSPNTRTSLLKSNPCQPCNRIFFPSSQVTRTQICRTQTHHRRSATCQQVQPAYHWDKDAFIPAPNPEPPPVLPGWNTGQCT